MSRSNFIKHSTVVVRPTVVGKSFYNSVVKTLQKLSLTGKQEKRKNLAKQEYARQNQLKI